jgi:hypothetical protein
MRLYFGRHGAMSTTGNHPDQPETPAPPAPRRVRPQARRAILPGLGYGILASADLYYHGSLGSTFWAQFGLGIAIVLGVAVCWVTFRWLVSALPLGGRLVSIVMAVAAAVYLLYWDSPWTKWLVIPTVALLLFAVALDYRQALSNLGKKIEQLPDGPLPPVPPAEPGGYPGRPHRLRG